MKKTVPKNAPLFSVIICLHKIGNRFFTDLKEYSKLDYSNFEIIIIPNKESHFNKRIPGVRIINPKKEKISLSEKRDIGWQSARGKYCAYIDDDAYPRNDWLTNALHLFNSDKNIGAVGGPNITPPEDPYWAKIGGHILESYLTSGQLQFRYLPLKRIEVAELQGVNIIIPTALLRRLGGYKNKLFSGDDSKICSDIRSLGFKIISDPDIVVYHHRRLFPKDHLRQIYSMGKHRGYFVKKYPDTLSPLYFLPLLLTIGLITGLCAFVVLPLFRLPFVLIFFLFFLLGYFASIRAGYLNAIVVSMGIILTHITYGFAFISGMISNNFYKRTS